MYRWISGCGARVASPSRVTDETVALREGVAPRDLVEEVAGRLAEVLRDDDAVLAVAANLVVVDLDRLVDLAERHVDLAQQQVLVVRGVCVELLDQLELARVRVEVLVDEEFVRGFEDEPLDVEPRD